MPDPVIPKIPVACFAPPLNDKTLTEYKKLFKNVEDKELKDCLDTLHKCTEAWWKQAESQATGQKEWLFYTKDGKEVRGIEQPLQPEQVESLWDTTPWMRELVAMEPILDKINPQSEKELRNAAFHLLWFAKEITLDREPMTTERLQ